MTAMGANAQKRKTSKTSKQNGSANIIPIARRRESARAQRVVPARMTRESQVLHNTTRQINWGHNTTRQTNRQCVMQTSKTKKARQTNFCKNNRHRGKQKSGQGCIQQQSNCYEKRVAHLQSSAQTSLTQDGPAS